MIANPMERIELLLAVGNHREAEELVRQALTEQADNPRLLAKLLDIHFAAKDAGKFVQDAEALRTKLDSDSNPLWQRALEMGRQIAPGHPLFGGGAGVAPTSRSKTTPGGSDNTIVRAQDTVVRRMPTAATPAFEQPQETVARPERSVSPLDFDLPSSANSDVTLPPLGRVEDKAKPADDLRALDLDFDLDELAATKGFDGGDATRPQFTPAPTSRPATNDDLPALPTAKQRQQTADSELQKLDFAFDEIKVQDASPLDLDEINTPPKSFESPIESKPAPKLALADEERDDLLASEDYVETKLDLATAYLDMDDTIGARSLLAEVMKEGNARQQLRARELLGRLPA
ncbi:MAG: FimV/HubP family polar landmark protein [Gammaproteobacteria bacterium]